MPALPDITTAEVLFFGGDIITMDDAKPVAGALAVSGGRILAVGQRNELTPLIGDRTKLIDLAGQTLMPGLIEPHTHPIISALLYDWTDVSGFNHPGGRETMAALRRAVERAAPGEWVKVFGYDPVLNRDLEALSADQLDEISPDNPILVMIQSMHTSFVNHLALERAGITDQTTQPEFGEYVKDKAGRLTGVVIEQGAVLPILAAIINESPSSGADLIDTQMKRYSRAGYTTIGVMGDFPCFPDAVHLLRQAVERNGAPVRAAFMHKASDLENGMPFYQGPNSDRFRAVGVKFWYDGSPYTGNMYLDQPFLNSNLMQKGLGIPKGECGYSMMPRETLHRLVQKYHDQGMQIAIHGQGDRAIRDIIDVYDAVLRKSPRKDHRHRIEHGALFPPGQLQRAADLGLTVSWHINHIYYYGEALRDDIIGLERASIMMPAETARQCGHAISLHNDSPMYPAEPFKLIRTAATRTTRKGAVIGQEQAVSVIDALKAVTINAAWQLFMEDLIGSLTPGKQADLTVLSDNPLKVDPEQLDRIRVIETWSDGRRTPYPESGNKRDALLNRSSLKRGAGHIL